MKKLIVMMLLAVTAVVSFSSCKSDKDKAREAVEAYLYKNMKNPESLKILSCEVRLDTIPFYLSEEMFDKAEKFNEALDKYTRYKGLSYLFIDEKVEWLIKSQEAKEALITMYKDAQQNDSTDIEFVAYVKSSGTNSVGGTVSNSIIFILDRNDSGKIIGNYKIDADFIEKFTILKMVCENYEFKKNKFGKYITDDMPYFEQFVMNDAE